MDALLVIDMQVGMLDASSLPHDVDLVVERINRVARTVRNRNGIVVFIQHRGAEGDSFAQGEPGWKLLPELDIQSPDLIVAKTTCDSFYESELDARL